MNKRTKTSEPQSDVVVSPDTDPGRWVRCDPCGQSFKVPSDERHPVCPQCGKES